MDFSQTFQMQMYMFVKFICCLRHPGMFSLALHPDPFRSYGWSLVRQQEAVPPIEDSNTWRSQHLRTFWAGGACFCPQTPELRKVSGIVFHLPGVHTPRQVGSQFLVLRLPQFLHAPTQNSKDLEKSTGICDLQARKDTGGPKERPSHISAVCPL